MKIYIKYAYAQVLAGHAARLPPQARNAHRLLLVPALPPRAHRHQPARAGPHLPPPPPGACICMQVCVVCMYVAVLLVAHQPARARPHLPPPPPGFAAASVPAGPIYTYIHIHISI